MYAVVTFGNPNWKNAEKTAKVTGRQKIAPRVYANDTQAKAVATHCKGTGSCSDARVYQCDSIELAKSTDISRVRPGERVIYSA